jgi:hypothetical protein
VKAWIQEYREEAGKKKVAGRIKEMTGFILPMYTQAIENRPLSMEFM